MLYVGINQINTDFGQLLGILPNMYGISLRVNKLNEYFLNKSSEGQLYIDNLKTIKFDNVDFSYDRNIIFEKMNLELSCDNKVIHIKGGNGIGKSTFVNLLTGLEKPDSGNVLINNINIEKLIVKLSKTKTIFIISHIPFSEYLIKNSGIFELDLKKY